MYYICIICMDYMYRCVFMYMDTWYMVHVYGSVIYGTYRDIGIYGTCIWIREKD